MKNKKFIREEYNHLKKISNKEILKIEDEIQNYSSKV